MTTTEKRRLAALHEAGHAVVAAEHGFQLHDAEIYERGGGLCRVEIPPRVSLESLKRELEYVVAGRIAVAIDTGESWRGLDLSPVVEREVAVKGGLRDRYGSYERACERLWGGRHYGAAWFRGVLPGVAERTVSILSKRWREVDEIAYRLWHNGKVDFLEDELDELEARSVGDASVLVRRLKRDARNKVVTRPNQAEVDALARFAADEKIHPADRGYARAKLAEWGYRRRAYR